MSAPDASTTAQATGQDGTKPTHVEGVIATEDEAALYADNDADFISLDGQSSTASMNSSVMEYRYENGRRYHSFRGLCYQEGQYVIPNDEREQDRLDLHHHIYTMVLDGELYRAPISNDIGRILDIGTGTGAWAIDMADKMPQAQVIGTDLSPIQPAWIPPNCTFEVDDFSSPWRFSAPFDLVHARGLEGSVADYPALFASAREALVPGGYFELAEATVGCFTDDDTKDKAPSFYKWVEHLKEASAKFGRPMGIAQNMRKWMEEAGFEDVYEEIRKIPFSPWPKDAKLKSLGRYQQFLMMEALDAYSFALFTRVLNWTPEQIKTLLEGVRRDLLDRNWHGYSNAYFIYGRKPKS